MSDVSTQRAPSGLRGFLLPEPLIEEANLWSAQSSHTQAGPRPGATDPQDDYHLTVHLSGEQTADTELQIRTHSPGAPGPDGAGFIWRYDGDTYWRGRDVPTAVSALEALSWSSSANTHAPDACTLSDGTVLYAYRSTVGPTTSVRVGVRSTAGAHSTQAVETITGSHEPYPCLCPLPDGRVLLFFWVVDSVDDTAQIRRYVSDDKGATWTLASSWCLSDPIDVSNYGTFSSGTDGYDLGRIRARAAGGQVLLVGHLQVHDTDTAYQDVIVQLASANLGGRFSTVETWTGASGSTSGLPDVEVADGLFIVALVDGEESGSGGVRFRRLANAFDALSNATELSPPGSGLEIAYTSTARGGGQYISDADLALWASEDGTLYCAMRQPTLGHVAVVIRSTDLGLTWGTVGNSNYTSGGGSTWSDQDQGSGGAYPTNFVGTFQRGRSLIFSNCVESTSTYDESLILAYLGGYSTHTLPGYKQLPVETSRVAWTQSYWGLDLPANIGWTRSVSGTYTETPAGYGVALTTTSGTISYARTGHSGTVAEGVGLLFHADITSGGGTTADRIALRVDLGDGSSRRRLSVRTGISGSDGVVALYDRNAGSQIGSTLTITGSANIQAMLWISEGKATLYARAFSTDSDRSWTQVATTTTANDSGTGTIDISFGCFATATIDATLSLQYVHDEWTGLGLWTPPTLPDDLFPAFYGAGLPIDVDGGARAVALGASTDRGDEWHFASRYDYPRINMMPLVHPSPRRRWRSTGVTAATFAWRRTDGSAGPHALSDTVGLYLDGCNWRTGELQGYDASAAAWETIGTIDLASGRTALPFTRRGDALIVNTGVSKTADQWIHYAAEEGATVAIIPTVGSTVYRRLETNTDGAWTDSDTKRPILQIASGEFDGTEPTTGTLEIWSPRGCLLVHSPRPSTAPTFTAWRVQVDAQDTADGYFEIGTLLFGWVVVSPYQYDWGRVEERIAGWALQENDDGSHYATELAPSRDAVEVAWVERGITTKPLYASTLAPDYVTGTATAGALPLGAPAGTASLIRGLYKRQRGGVRPLVYLPRIDRGTPDSAMLTDPERFLYAHIESSSVRLEGVQGEEFESERKRIAALRLRGIV